jgi:hypothetical protein
MQVMDNGDLRHRRCRNAGPEVCNAQGWGGQLRGRRASDCDRHWRRVLGSAATATRPAASAPMVNDRRRRRLILNATVTSLRIERWCAGLNEDTDLGVSTWAVSLALPGYGGFSIARDRRGCRLISLTAATVTPELSRPRVRQSCISFRRRGHQRIGYLQMRPHRLLRGSTALPMAIPMTVQERPQRLEPTIERRLPRPRTRPGARA